MLGRCKQQQLPVGQMESLSLGRFTIATPVWPLETNLLEVLHVMSGHDCDRGVVVDHQNRPLGLLTRARLLAHWPLPQGSILDLSLTLSGPKQVLEADAVKQSSGSRLLEPLWLIPSETTLAVAWPEIQAADCDRRVVALVDRLGQFAGLLDSCKLLQTLQQPLDAAQFVAMPTLADALEPGYPVGLTCAIDLRWSNQAAQQGFGSDGMLAALVGLIQQLPLPLMLQTGAGRVLMRNRAWQSQVGLLQDPDRLRQAAAPLLRFPVDSSFYQSSVDQPAPEAGSVLEPPRASEAAPAGEQSDCEAVYPGSCVCWGMTQDGLERAWRFTRLPLAMPTTALSPTAIGEGRGLDDRLDRQGHLAKAAEKASFQLGRLRAKEACGLISPIEDGSSGRLARGGGQSAVSAQQRAGRGAVSWPVAAAGLESVEAESLSVEQAVGAVTQAWSGDESLWLVLAEDCTEQHQVTRELAAKNADLTQLNRFKDEFLACISHELKTPLTAILGLSSLLQESALGSLNDRQAHYVQLIHQSGRHLSTIVNNILDLTRIETEQLELNLAPVNLAEACIRACRQLGNPDLYPHLSADQVPQPTQGIEDELTEIARLSQELKQHGRMTLQVTARKRLLLEIDPGLETLTADDLRLRQMLTHLISNATKFTEDDDEIGLQVSRWQGWIAFTVWDTGIGIPEDKQHLIFQKFQQLENPLTRRFEGAGLGLVLTQRLARLHGGDVTFISTAGQGSQFTLLLPPVPPAHPLGASFWMDHAASRSPSSRPRSPDNRLVLIVESAVDTIDRLSGQLKGMGYWVAIARSGTEAVEKVRRLQPCIVFLNPILPLLSGWDVVTLLKANPETQNIPVVIMATSAERHQALQYHVDRFLRLPIQPEHLWQTLAELVPAPPIGNPQGPRDRLTILLLALDSSREAPVGTPQNLDLMPLLQAHGYRLLEVDDLEHANLLSRFWKPDVVLLYRVAAPVQHQLQQLANQPYLATLPLVTLTQEATAAAHALGLSAFPCLAFLAATPALGESAAILPPDSALLQAIQVAAGIGGEPSILSVDLVNVPEQPIANCGADASAAEETSPEMRNPSLLNRSQGLHALIQYLQLAGLHSALGQAWSEVVWQLQRERVTTLLIYLRPPIGSQIQAAQTIARLYQRLAILEQLPNRPRILVLDHHETGRGLKGMKAEPESIALNWQTLINRLQTIAQEVIPPTLPMNDLLKKIRTTLTSEPGTTR